MIFCAESAFCYIFFMSLSPSFYMSQPYSLTLYFSHTCLVGSPILATSCVCLCVSDTKEMVSFACQIDRVATMSWLAGWLADTERTYSDCVCVCACFYDEDDMALNCLLRIRSCTHKVTLLLCWLVGWLVGLLHPIK